MEENKSKALPTGIISTFEYFLETALKFDSLNNSWKGAADPDWEGTTEYYVADEKKQSFGNNNWRVAESPKLTHANFIEIIN